MAKITLTFCDVKPCNFPAEREFEVNGEKIYVCGESCFVKFWSREYAGWKNTPYLMRASFNSSMTASLDESSSLKDPAGQLGSNKNLQLIKPL
jgi:hypothetical protein